MKTPTARHVQSLSAARLLLAGTLGALLARSTCASIAYGTINNFDTVNDTGVPAHGFEIELDDIHVADITYTFDWNHYGTPKITEDNSDPLHSKVFVRYASAKTNGVWAAYTAVPAGPIPPTQGHQFTNPSINFGGEHFGTGYRVSPSAVKYNWLIDDGSGNLVHGGAVNVATPLFVNVPVPAGAPPQIQAIVVPPPPPAPPLLEFGQPSWVKEIRTSSHNNAEVKLRDLVGNDPDYPGAKDWRNGEPDEVEVEWQLFQTDYNSTTGGPNGIVKGAPEELKHGDETITRRYEFYKYTGPIDPDTGEALADVVGVDGIHGVGANADVVIVGDFFGAQMSGVHGGSPVGLIDHLPDGEIGTYYGPRTVVIAGDSAFVATSSGSLPNGLSFDSATGEVSGAPTSSGVFIFKVEVSSANNPVVSKSYAFSVADSGVALPPHSSIDTGASPREAGTTSGTGVYATDEKVTVVAQANPGFAFQNWTDNGAVVSTNANYEFTTGINRSLTANFVISPSPNLQIQLSPDLAVLTWSTNYTGFTLEQSADLNGGAWTGVLTGITTTNGGYQVNVPPSNQANFFRLTKP